MALWVDNHTPWGISQNVALVSTSMHAGNLISDYIKPLSAKHQRTKFTFAKLQREKF